MSNPFEIPSVFIDNDKPEMVWDTTVAPPPAPSPEPPHEYCRHDVVVNRPHSDNPIPGPFIPDYCYNNATNLQPNPVPNTYLAPGHHCCPPDRNPIPMNCEPPHHPPADGGCFVTKGELNKILTNIANADIFKDLSTNGTTVSVGGVKKGTKFDKLTFAKLVELMLYSDTLASEEYACNTSAGKTVLNSTVKYTIGGLSEGTSLKGMTISQILEAMLCGTNKWGTYAWKSDIVSVTAGTTTLDAQTLFAQFVTDYNANNKYELHVLCKDEDKETESAYIYDQIIAQYGNAEQKTNVNITGVPTDITWSYNTDTKKITLNTITATTVDIAIVLIRR